MGVKLVGKEFAVYEATQSLTENLKFLLAAIKTIQPTSVESERAFFASASLVTKIRNRLADNTIDALCFFRINFNHIYAKNM